MGQQILRAWNLTVIAAGQPGPVPG